MTISHSKQDIRFNLYEMNHMMTSNIGDYYAPTAKLALLRFLCEIAITCNEDDIEETEGKTAEYEAWNSETEQRTYFRLR